MKKEGIYEFPDQKAGNKPYVGQTDDFDQRLGEYENSGRLNPSPGPMKAPCFGAVPNNRHYMGPFAHFNISGDSPSVCFPQLPAMTIDEYRSLHDRLASVREKMKSAAIAWRSSTPQVTVEHGIEFARYGERLVLELFVEVSIPNGRSACWWIDLEPKDRVVAFQATLRNNDGILEIQVWERHESEQEVDSALKLVESLMLEIAREASVAGASIFEFPENISPTPDSPPS